MFALEDFNYDKIKMLKEQMEKNVWYAKNVPEYKRDEIKNKTKCAKFVLLLCILNPIITIPTIFSRSLQPDWLFCSTANKTLQILLQVLYVLHVVSAYGVVYTHLFIHVYFNLYLNIQMNLLSMYFKLISANNDNMSTLQNVHNYLIKGIREHTNLLG